MIKYYFVLFIYFVINIIGIIFDFLTPNNVINRILLGVLILFTLIYIIKFYSEIHRNIEIDKKTSTGLCVVSIINIVVNLIITVPVEMSVQMEGLKYSDCRTLCISYLSVVLTIFALAILIHRRLFIKHKVIAIIIDLVLATNEIILFVRAILLDFGIYWVKNSEFIFLQQ